MSGNIKNLREQALEAILIRDYERAKDKLKFLAREYYTLAKMSNQQSIKQILVEAGDSYFNAAKMILNDYITNKKDDTEKNGNKTKPVQREPQKPLINIESTLNPEPPFSYAFHDIIGLKEVKEIINLKMIVPFKKEEIASKYDLKSGGGILLYGPGGTGKTSMARATAGELNVPLFEIKYEDIIRNNVKKTVQNIAAIFAEAQKNPRSILFFDEVSDLLPKRPKSEVKRQVVQEFLTRLDGYEEKNEGILLIGTTNRPWEIRDEILRSGRMDEKVYIGPPNLRERIDLFRLNLNDLSILGNLDYNKLGELTKNYSGAEIKQICNKAKQICIGYYNRTHQTRRMEMDDFKKAIEKIVPTITTLGKYDKEQLEKFSQRSIYADN